MCFNRKQNLPLFLAVLAVLFTFSSAPGAAAQNGSSIRDRAAAGGVNVGDGFGGVTDRAYVTAPPNYFYVVEKERGSFLDCGAGSEARATDSDGRDQALMTCGVTLTETIVIPAAAQSARVIVHY